MRVICRWPANLVIQGLYISDAVRIFSRSYWFCSRCTFVRLVLLMLLAMFEMAVMMVMLVVLLSHLVTEAHVYCLAFCCCIIWSPSLAVFTRAGCYLMRTTLSVLLM